MKFLGFALLICSACAAFAQEQEGKLMTRLLRPDMTLGNSTQNKKFIADKASVDQSAHVSTFYLQKRHEAQTYSDTHEFAAATFASRTATDLPTTASLMAARSTSPLRSYETPSARVSVELRDSHRTAASSDFADNRTFAGKGKSQKFLDHKNKPMTIDDIRELLNKSK